MKKLVSCPVFLMMLVFFSFNIRSNAHSINFETSKEFPVVTVKAFFSINAPLVNAVVDIYPPGDDQAYQTGRTDKTGSFAFIPEQTGEWTVRVDDERGHRDRITITVSDDFFNTHDINPGETDAELEPFVVPVINKNETEKVFPLFYRIITGLSIIIGLTGIFYGVKARQALRNNN